MTPFKVIDTNRREQSDSCQCFSEIKAKTTEQLSFGTSNVVPPSVHALVQSNRLQQDPLVAEVLPLLL